MKVLIICQTGSEIGLGHLSRALSLASALERREAAVRLAVLGPGAKGEQLERFAHRLLPGGEEGLEPLREWIGEERPDAVALDMSPAHLPEGLGGLLEEIRRREIFVAGVDGPLEHAGRLDLLFIPSFLLEKEKREQLPAGLEVRWGWECVIADIALEPRAWAPGEEVLVLTGGSDAAGLGETLPGLLDRRLPEGTRLHWVQGPYAEPPNWPDNPRLPHTVHRAPDRLDELMREAPYALTVYGVSFFELLKYGVPTVVFSPYGEKDRRHLELVEPAGAALTAGSAEEAVERLAGLMASDTKARRLSEKSRELVTDGGADQLAEEILRPGGKS